MIFQQLFGFGYENGYPKERVMPEQRNKIILDGVKAITYRPLIDILKNLDSKCVKETIRGEKLSELLYLNCKDEKIAKLLQTL